MSTRVYKYCLIVLWLTLLTGCIESARMIAEPEKAAGNRLHQLVEAYFDEVLELNPVRATMIGDHRFDDRFANDISPQHRHRRRELEARYLDRVRAIDSAALSPADRFTRDLFLRDRNIAIEGFRFPDHLLPVSQLFNRATLFAQMGSGRGIHRFKTVTDYMNFLSRMDGFVIWADQAIVNMRVGMASGVVQPRVVMERVLPQLAAHVVEDPTQSLFHKPVERFPDGISMAMRAKLTRAYEEAIRTKIVPAYSRLHDFIRDEYLPNSRESFGLNALPDGKAWYRYLTRVRTTTRLTPGEIHALGLKEVARIHGEMRKVIQSLGLTGELNDFFRKMASDPRLFFSSREEMLAAYRGLQQRIHAALPRIFKVMPKAGFEIRPIEAFREKAAPAAHYQRPSSDGARPAVFYVNTFRPGARPKWRMETLYLHEAEPGHHFQITIQQETRDLPRFRRFGGYTAYMEGWALYAERLGRELGLYTDPYQYLGHLDAELWRAVRLVVDTGLHEMGWSRQRVLNYMFANAPVTRTRAVAEAERYMVLPGQALAYKIGQIKISELRRLAEGRLGDKFSLRAFHAQVLGDGALPLDVLEEKLKSWIERQA